MNRRKFLSNAVCLSVGAVVASSIVPASVASVPLVEKSPDLMEYREIMIRAISNGMRVPYEMLVRDLGSTQYSCAREHLRNSKALIHFGAPAANRPVGTDGTEKVLPGTP